MAADAPQYDNPLIVQSDGTVLLEVASPKSGDARAALARFAELEKSPEHVHTYRISPLSLWNAASAGVTADDVGHTLVGFAKYPVPDAIVADVRDQMARFGRLRIVRDFDSGGLALTTAEPALLAEVPGTGPWRRSSASGWTATASRCAWVTGAR